MAGLKKSAKRRDTTNPNTVLVVTSNIMEYIDASTTWNYGVSAFRDYSGSLWELAQAIGNTASHESGHAFGLEHHLDLSQPATV